MKAGFVASFLAVTALAGFGGAANAHAAYDQSFGRGGMVVLPADAHSKHPAVSDCRVTAAGDVTVAVWSPVRPTSVKAHMRLATVTSHGNVRRSAGGARTLSAVADSAHRIFDFDLDESGRLVYARSVKKIDGPLAIVRLRSNGSVDRSFGHRGRVVINRTTRGQVYLSTLPSGRIAVVFTYNVSHPRPTSINTRLVLLDADGSLVQTFGTQGVVTVSGFQPSWTWLSSPRAAIAEDSNRAIYLGGNRYTPGPSQEGAQQVLKFAGDGNLDATFAAAGIFQIPSRPSTNPFVTQPIVGTAMAIYPQADGTILLGVERTDNPDGPAVGRLERYNPASPAMLWASGAQYEGLSGDGGFPDVFTSALEPTALGYVSAQADVYYNGADNVSGKVNYRLWRDGGASPDIDIEYDVHRPFTPEAFAPSPDGKYLYMCGTVGKGSHRTHVAVRRVVLG